MDIKNLETFIRTVELNSFTRAAEDLGYVQSTVTMQIRQLEQELNFRLFDRIGKSIFLTAQGREFLAYANSIVQAKEQACAIGKSENNMQGVFRIGTATSLFPSTLRIALPAYRKRYPNIELQIQTDRHLDASIYLNENKVDMLYRSGPLNLEPNFVCHYKREEHLVFVVSATHPLAQKKSVRLKDLFDYTFIVTEQDGICYTMLRKLAILHGFTIHHNFIIDALNALLMLLVQSESVSFLPEYYISAEIKDGSLKILDVEDMEPQIYYSQILFHKDKWITPYMRGLVDIIRDVSPER